MTASTWVTRHDARVEQHAMRIRMLGNAWVYVTCKCMDARRTGWKGRTTKSPRVKIGAPEWKSLGDFPVGTDSQLLLDAYRRHLNEA